MQALRNQSFQHLQPDCFPLIAAAARREKMKTQASQNAMTDELTHQVEALKAEIAEWSKEQKGSLIWAIVGGIPRIQPWTTTVIFAEPK